MHSIKKRSYTEISACASVFLFSSNKDIKLCANIQQGFVNPFRLQQLTKVLNDAYLSMFVFFRQQFKVFFTNNFKALRDTAYFTIESCDMYSSFL